jgi:hypothetical protein
MHSKNKNKRQEMKTSCQEQQYGKKKLLALGIAQSHLADSYCNNIFFTINIISWLCLLLKKSMEKKGKRSNKLLKLGMPMTEIMGRFYEL